MTLQDYTKLIDHLYKTIQEYNTKIELMTQERDELVGELAVEKYKFLNSDAE